MTEVSDKIKDAIKRSRPRVLLIEDDLAYAALTVKRLDDYQVEHRGTLLEGMALLEKKPFDVVLLDLTLPDEGGLDSFIKVAEYEKQIPIIILSGNDSEEIRIQALMRGAQDYLVKHKIQSAYMLDKSISNARIRKWQENQSLADRKRHKKILEGLWILSVRIGALARNALESDRDYDEFEEIIKLISEVERGKLK